MSTQTPTAADRDAKLAAVHDTLERSVAALVTGQDWRRAMEFAAKFRSRSFSNSLLIYVQHHDAYDQGRVPEPVPTFVAGYRQWQSLGRQVHRGARGYAILAPVVARYAANHWSEPRDQWRRLGPREQPRGGEILRTQLVTAKVTHVWDVSATDGPPLPVVPAPKLLEGRAPDGLWEALTDLVTDYGFALRAVPNAAAIHGANGVTNYETRTVSYRTDVDDASKCRTLGHELAHILLHGPDSEEAGFHEGIVEVEAESVALMLFAAHDMDSSPYTVPYVSTWASTVPGKEPVEVIAATAERVRATAVKILDRLNTATTGTGDPPGLHRSPGLTGSARSTPDLPPEPPADLLPDAGPDRGADPEGVRL